MWARGDFASALLLQRLAHEGTVFSFADVPCITCRVEDTVRLVPQLFIRPALSALIDR